MKYIHFVSIFMFLFIGCSSTYTLQNYPSKQKFYENFNNFAKNKNVKVTSNNDSVFYLRNTVISKDTLYTTNKSIDFKLFVIPKNKVKEINFISYNYKSANLILTNGEILKADSIKFSTDSIKFLQKIKERLVRNKVVPLDKVRTISYNKNWLGIPPGLLLGGVTGLLSGAVGIFPFYESRDEPGYHIKDKDIYAGILFGSSIGIILGGVAGWFVGHTYTFRFNH